MRKSLAPDRMRRRFMQMVPCGHCLGCRGEQARQWSVRIMHESAMHEASWFLTLTYDDEKVPRYGSLDPKDLQRFFKAVRRGTEEEVSYYACGEYGETTQRPHYHAVLFGPQFLDKYILRDSGSNRVWRSPSLEHYWDHGISEFGAVTPASAAYVAGYVRKKIREKDDPDAYLRVDPGTGELVELEKEFARMSLKPAIGKRWIEKYWADVYPRDMVVVDGYEAKPPRYYDKWLEANRPELAMEVRAKRIEAQEDVSSYTLNAREAIHRSRVDLFETRGAL